MSGKALLVCEREAHSDHARRLLAIARWFRTGGWSAVLALPDPARVAGSDAAFPAVLQAPLWPSERASPRWSQDVPATLGGFLIDAGAAHPMTLKATVSAARHLVDLIAPDLVIADNAPASILACRHRCPVVVIGNGAPFPARAQDETDASDRLARWICQELSITDEAPSLAGLFAGEGALRFQLSVMGDKGRAAPAEPCLPVDLKGARRTGAGDALLLDLSTAAIQDDALFAAILRHGHTRWLWSPALPAAVATALTNAGATVLSKPVREDDIAQAGAVVHANGPDHVLRLAAAGIPQLILLDARKHDAATARLGRQVAEQGAGIVRTLTQSSVPALADDFLALPGMAGAAHALSREIADDPLPEWTTALERLLPTIIASRG